jgi:integrase
MQDKVNYISPETFEKILAYVPNLGIRKQKDEDVQFLFKILYWCALRPMEGIVRSKEDFNLEDRELSLGKTKTTKNDTATIPKIFLNELTYYLDSKEDGRLFPGLTYHTFFHWIIRIGTALEIKAWTTPESISGEKTKGHIFRKTVGKDMLEGAFGDKAKAIPIISKHLRHKKPSTTIDHYLKASQEAVKEVF